jgi:DNA-binding transcriptional LysR family regulator
MNITSLYYFQELAKNLHMTNTADKLYISQQTLSNHIKRLEEYYGTKLFNRKPSLSLTYAGECLLTFAQDVIQKEQNLKGIISDIESNEKGLLRIGASIARGMISLPQLIPKFNKRFPNVEIRYVDSLSLELETQVEEGNLDFAIVLSKKPNNKLIDIPILRDQIYLCVPDSLLVEYYGEEAEELKKRSLTAAYVEDFSRLPFSMYSNRLGKSIFECFEVANCQPKVVFTTSFSQLLLPLCIQGLSACFMTQMNLSSVIDQFSDKVNIFPLYFNGEPMVEELFLIRHKDRYLPSYAKEFLDILFNYFSDIEQIHLASICK